MKKSFKISTKLISLILMISVSLSIVFITIILNIPKKLLKDDTKEQEEIKDVIEEPKEEEEKHYELSLIAVGDNLIHSSIYNDANRLANYNGYDFTPMYKYIKEIVSNYDIGYVNQETILGGKELGLSNYPRFNSPYEVGDALIDAGFNLVSLATNHTVDRGKEAVLNSCNYWNAKEGVLTSGSYCSEEQKEEIKIQEKNNITYTMLNYTYGTNGMPVTDNYLVNVWPTNLSINDPSKDTKYQEYREQVKTDIEKVRDKVDVLIVAMHWGVEYTHNPTIYEIDMAEYLASLDVDIIIGTHPHVIQPVTWIDDTLVIYSLGNFLSAQYQNQDTCKYYKCTVGLMTNLKIEKTVKEENTTINITNVENELIYTYYNQKTWKDYLVIPFSNPEIKNLLPKYNEVYETYKEVVQRLDNTMYVKELAS